jgi:hypothetical protein
MRARRPIDILDCGDADMLAGWLRAHPGAEVIRRVRSRAYADGAAVARRGDPDRQLLASDAQPVRRGGQGGHSTPPLSADTVHALLGDGLRHQGDHAATAHEQVQRGRARWFD